MTKLEELQKNQIDFQSEIDVLFLSFENLKRNIQLKNVELNTAKQAVINEYKRLENLKTSKIDIVLDENNKIIKYGQNLTDAYYYCMEIDFPEGLVCTNIERNIVGNENEYSVEVLSEPIENKQGLIKISKITQ
jgi:hypothetical protein